MAATPGRVPQPHPSGATLAGLEEFWAAAGATHLVLDGPTLARAAGAADQDWANCGRAVAPGGSLDVLDRPVWVGDAVWNPLGGYPADPAYRDFHRHDLERHPPQRRLGLPESSWGAGKQHGSWATESTRWVWQALRDAARFRGLPPGPGQDAAWRQLTLLQASDWPFLITRDQATRYAPSG